MSAGRREIAGQAFLPAENTTMLGRAILPGLLPATDHQGPFRSTGKFHKQAFQVGPLQPA
jgi:hypothetical protein